MLAGRQISMSIPQELMRFVQTVEINADCGNHSRHAHNAPKEILLNLQRILNPNQQAFHCAMIALIKPFSSSFLTDLLPAPATSFPP